MTIKWLYLCLAVLFCHTVVFAQNAAVDSLKNLVKQYDLVQNGSTSTLKDSVKVKLYQELSDYTYTTHPEESIAYNRKALKIAEKIRYDKGILYNNYILGMYYSSSSDYLLSLQHLNIADSIARKLKNDLRLANIASEKGIVFSKMGNYPEAVKFSLKALEFYEKTNNLQLFGNSLVNIGILYKHQNKFKQALAYYKKAIAVYNKLDNEESDYSKAAAYCNMGQTYLKMGNNEMCINSLAQSQRYADKVANPYLNAENSHTLAATFFNKKDYKKSILNYQKAWLSYDSINDKSGVARTKINLAYTFFKDKQFKKALQYNAEGLELAKSIQQLEWQKDAYEDRSEMFVQQNNFKEAYKNQVLFKKINDSMFNANQTKKITELQMQYSFDKLQQKSKQTQRQTIVKLNDETNRLRFIKNTVVLFSVLLMVIVGFIFYNFHQAKKQRKVIDLQKAELEDKNYKILEALSEKEVLLKEIHHRVKNNLQIISSLLNIQAQNIQDLNVRETIKEGQSRLQAMSLIHQSLYQSEELDAIHIENYFEELTSYLRQLYSGNNSAIVISIEAKDLYFDIDTAIPLGLIVNELVSNAFKYAFSEKKQGHIKIYIHSVDDLNYQLSVSDNGKGMPSGFQLEDSKSLGLKLVTILSRQLRGSLQYENRYGTTFTIKFKDLKVFNSLRHSQ